MAARAVKAKKACNKKEKVRLTLHWDSSLSAPSSCVTAVQLTRRECERGLITKLFLQRRFSAFLQSQVLLRRPGSLSGLPRLACHYLYYSGSPTHLLTSGFSSIRSSYSCILSKIAHILASWQPSGHNLGTLGCYLGITWALGGCLLEAIGKPSIEKYIL